MSKLIFEKSKPGRSAFKPSMCDVATQNIDKIIPSKFLRTSAPKLPEVGELELVRHYIELSHKNMSIDANFYPLGS
ncbi:aminomethyl-transferring glycine dehydrogenase subunit GcvPB, partial [Candidatus Peregrinibacteria bacterium]|nr:aminomethyl-transferring glycine dehydrogenase subunit GcvPB [Candidatus Peregrinibacteria bacterium]